MNSPRLGNPTGSFGRMSPFHILSRKGLTDSEAKLQRQKLDTKINDSRKKVLTKSSNKPFDYYRFISISDTEARSVPRSLSISQRGQATKSEKLSRNSNGGIAPHKIWRCHPSSLAVDSTATAMSFGHVRFTTQHRGCLPDSQTV